MAYSVSLWFGEGAEARVRCIWQGLADAGVETFTGGPIRPHVTLAHALELEVDPFVTALEGRLASYPAFDITFPGLGLFVDSGILYLSTIMTDVLWMLHRDVSQLASAHGGRSNPYYQPDHWTPHCTLAVGLTPEAMLNAVAACQELPFPLTLSATCVGIIENLGERELLALPLPVRK
jgi:2'-5' RNA ligase